MSKQSSHDDQPKVQATTIHASKGGNAGKWLLGGLVAVLLAGGGYLAWKNSTPTQTAENQANINDQYAADTVHAGPLPSDQNGPAQPAVSDDSASPAAQTSTPAVTPSRATHRRTQPVPETVIGLTPVSATADENVVVNGARRPVWTRMPTARRLAAYYPEFAAETGREGEAHLACTIEGNGALDCTRVSETSHAGFGNAALRVSRTLRHAQQFADGSNAVGAPVNLRVVFRLPEDDRRG